MNRLSFQLGMWSAVFCVLTFIMFTVGFVIVLATPPLFFWTNLAAYITRVQEQGSFGADFARLSMLLFAPAFVILLNAVHETAAANHKIWTRNSLSMGIIFATLISLHYFVQLTAVRLSIQAGQIEGLEQVVQANPLSALSAINMLGITLFLGLSTLFLAPVFGDGRLQKIIRYALIINGLCCLVGGVSYILQINVLLFLTINFGMGGAMMVALIGLAVFFRRQMFVVVI
ncbi:MAG: hypothetical protein GY796_32465 [Chloroflexi bacterium]|nr:hypothetical protein [Chloroflexota bacterium]